MTKVIKNQYKALLAEEERLAERVVYLMRALTPRPWWHLFIPFKFLLEYFSRKKQTRQFTEKHLRFKRMALDGARMGAETGEESQSRQKMHGELRDFWLHELKLESTRLYELFGQMLDKLFDHYLQLFRTSKESYIQMVLSAYSESGEYRRFLEEVETMEKEIDWQFARELGKSQLDADVELKQTALKKVRERYLKELF